MRWHITPEPSPAPWTSWQSLTALAAFPELPQHHSPCQPILREYTEFLVIKAEPGGAVCAVGRVHHAQSLFNRRSATSCWAGGVRQWNIERVYTFLACQEQCSCITDGVWLCREGRVRHLAASQPHTFPGHVSALADKEQSPLPSPDWRGRFLFCDLLSR